MEQIYIFFCFRQREKNALNKFLTLTKLIDDVLIKRSCTYNAMNVIFKDVLLPPLPRISFPNWNAWKRRPVITMDTSWLTAARLTISTRIWNLCALYPPPRPIYLFQTWPTTLFTKMFSVLDAIVSETRRTGNFLPLVIISRPMKFQATDLRCWRS